MTKKNKEHIWLVADEPAYLTIDVRAVAGSMDSGSMSIVLATGVNEFGSEVQEELDDPFDYSASYCMGMPRWYIDLVRRWFWWMV